MDTRLPGVTLTVTGILAIIPTLTRTEPRHVAADRIIAGTMLLVLGVLLRTYAIAIPQ